MQKTAPSPNNTDSAERARTTGSTDLADYGLAFAALPYFPGGHWGYFMGPVTNWFGDSWVTRKTRRF